MCQNCYINNYNRRKRESKGKEGLESRDGPEPKLEADSEYDYKGEYEWNGKDSSQQEKLDKKSS